MSKKKSPSLLEHPQVKELLAVMEKHHTDSMKDLLDVIGYVGEVEKQLDTAVRELAAVRQEISEMRGPVKPAVRDAARAMEQNVTTLRERVAELKDNIIEGCKNLLAAFKEKGTQALSNAARFFRVRPALEAIRHELTENIKFDDRAIAKIDAVSAEYHKAGLHVKNMGRALVGKEAVTEAKAPGKVAKAASLPFRRERACYLSARKSVENALDRLSRLEKAAEHKPSIRKTMQKYQEQIDRAPRPAPVRDVPRQER